MALAVVALLLWGVFDGELAVAALCIGLLMLLSFHLGKLAVLTQWVRGALPEGLPEATGAWGAVFDTLNRRERDMRESHERLSVALERFRGASQAMPDGVIYLSGNDTIEWLNQRAEQHFGLDHGHDIGVSLTALARQPELAHYLESGQHGDPLVIRSPRRSAIRLLIQVVPFGDQQKMLVSRDITQIEKLETMRRDFIANVSHELRTPLTVVSGFVETVLDGLNDFDDEDVCRFLNMALEQSTRMQRLIEDLLTLSALETGEPAPTEERVDAIALVSQVYQEALALSSGRHDITLELDERDRGDILLGSQKELHSALANLATNAVRYTPASGTIRLNWRHTAGGAEFSVVDNGIGIDPQHVPRLTERFFRVDRGRSRETGGTGLGLAIVKHIVSRHQASLHIESELGKGSRFSVSFPNGRLTRVRRAAQI